MTESGLQLDAVAERSFHGKLLQIDGDLHQTDITALKFLLKDVSQKSKLSKVSTGHDLFAGLEASRLMSARDPKLLVEMFQSIGRFDLIDYLDVDEDAEQGLTRTGKISHYRHLLFEIAQDLTNEDVRKISFLADKLSKAKREKLTSGFDLLSMLEESKLLSSTHLDKLQEYLVTLGRHDLVLKLHQFSGSQGVPSKPVEKVAEKAPSKRAGTVSENDNSPAAKQREKQGNNTTDTERAGNALPESIQLELAGGLSQTDNVGDFFLNLGYSSESIERCNAFLAHLPREQRMFKMLTTAPMLHGISLQEGLIKLVNALRFTGCMQLSQSLVLKFKDHLPAEYWRDEESALLRQSHENRSISMGEAAPSATPQPVYNNVSVPVRREPGQLPEYKMDAIPRGVCVILNNTKFTYDGSPEAEELRDRIGSDVDAGKLVETFTKLQFTVMRYDNLSALTMTRTLERIRNESVHGEHDCFVCCVLSHGRLGDKVFGADGRQLNLNDLLNPFKNTQCPALAGKPKLFFMQACQGQDRQEGMPVQSDVLMETDSPDDLVTVPNEADILIGYATAPGFVSYRSKSKGSWYIGVLTEMLDKYVGQCDLLEILTMVNREVGKKQEERNNRNYKQAPAPKYTLRKKLIFR